MVNLNKDKKEQKSILENLKGNIKKDQANSKAKSEIIIVDQFKKASDNEANLPEIISRIAPLLQGQRKDLLQILLRNNAIFQGRRSDWEVNEVHMKLKDNAKPSCDRPYPIPLKQVEVTRMKFALNAV